MKSRWGSSAVYEALSIGAPAREDLAQYLPVLAAPDLTRRMEVVGR